MKPTLFLAILSLLFVMGVSAQSPQYSIFEALEKRPKPGEGGVIIHQSEGIKRLVGTRIDSDNVDLNNGKTFIKTMGYRIQVYSGNLQRISKEELQNLQSKINELYSDIETYPDYVAPFWRLYVGDYPTFEEAFQMLRELRKTFPQRKNEFYIIECEIRLPLE